MDQLHINGKWLAQNLPGAGRFSAEMVMAIAETGRCDLVLHIPADAVAPLPSWTADSGVEIRRAPFSGSIFEQFYLPMVTGGRLLLNFAGSAPLIKRRQLVTMHAATAFRCPLGYRKASVVAQHALYWILARAADGLMTVSEFSAHEWCDVLRIDVDRFMVAGGSADSLAGVCPKRPESIPGGDHYLVVGSPSRHKNLHAPVTAMTGSGRRVVIVGAADDLTNSLAAQLCDDLAVVVERVTDAELVWLYRHSRALVVPSTYEGFCLPALEAQTLGCPVVCSDSAAIPEVCRDGALYFDPDDPDMLLAQLDRLESEIGLADDLRRRGCANARRYSWIESAERVVDWVTSTRFVRRPGRESRLCV